MDLGGSVEDQFSKLHPCLPVTARIGILGAGPSGLSAAYGLTKLGYKNVTVLEKYHTVSGMCESEEIEGIRLCKYCCFLLGSCVRFFRYACLFILRKNV